MIKSAIHTLRCVQKKAMSCTVRYVRGSENFLFRAIIGCTLIHSVPDCGVWVRTEIQDFIFFADECQIEPKIGDIIIHDSKHYEVLSFGGKPGWYWSDPFHTAMRVHTKLISRED